MKNAFLAAGVLAVLASIAAGETEKREPGLETYGTIHSASVYVLGATDEVKSVGLQYRPKGAGEWCEGLPLVKILQTRFTFTGSLFYLKPATTYEVRAVLKDGDGKEIKTLAGEVTTRPDEVAYGKGRTLKVGKNEEFKTIQAAVKEAGPGDTVLITSGAYYEAIEEWPRSGKPGAPIVIRGEKGAILEGRRPRVRRDRQGLLEAPERGPRIGRGARREPRADKRGLLGGGELRQSPGYPLHRQGADIHAEAPG